MLSFWHTHTHTSSVVLALPASHAWLSHRLVMNTADDLLMLFPVYLAHSLLVKARFLRWPRLITLYRSTFFAWHRNYIISEKFLISCIFCNNNHLVSHLYHFYTFSALFGDYKSRFHQKKSVAKGIRCKNVLSFILKCITIRQKNNFLSQFRYFTKILSTTNLWNLVKNTNGYILAARLQEHL